MPKEWFWRAETAPRDRRSQLLAPARDRRANQPDVARLCRADRCGPSTNRAARQCRSASPFADEIMPPSVAHPAFEPQACHCRRTRRDRQRRAQSGLCVAEREFAAMQRRHRRCETQSKTGAGLGAARLQPHESLHRMLAIGFRDSRTVIGHAEQHLAAVGPRFDQDLLVAGATTASAPSGCAAATGLPYLIAFSTRFASAWLINSRLP